MFRQHYHHNCLERNQYQQASSSRHHKQQLTFSNIIFYTDESLENYQFQLIKESLDHHNRIYNNTCNYKCITKVNWRILCLFHCCHCYVHICTLKLVVHVYQYNILLLVYFQHPRWLSVTSVL
jgi:hypothetical protein